MSLRERRNLLVPGLLIVTLSAVLLGHLHCPGSRPRASEEDRCMTLVGHQLPVQGLAFSRDGATLTTAGSYFSATAPGLEVIDWDVAEGQPRAKHPIPLKAVRCLSFAPGDRRLAVDGVDRGAWLWDPARPDEPRRLGEYRSLVCALAFSGDGSLLATSDLEEVVTLWDVVNAQPRARWQGPNKGRIDLITSLAFAPCGVILAGGGSDKIVRLWSEAAWEQPSPLRGHTHPIEAVAFAPDGRTLASADRGGVVKLWDVAGGAQRATLRPAGDEAAALAFSPDGQTLAVAVGQDVQLWDVAARRCLASLKGHTGRVRCLAFAPDGTRLASGSFDRTVRLWDVAGYVPTRNP